MNTDRHNCAYCKARRFEKFMVLVFNHPLIGLQPIWACAGNCGGKLTSKLLSCQDSRAIVKLALVIPGSEGLNVRLSGQG